MDPLEVVPVRFHFGGEFDFDGYSLNYVRGRIALSHIERDKLSLPELRGFLSDPVNLTVEDVDFHWLPPGADMSNGVRSLADDQSCRYMSDCIIVGEVAEVYAEIYKAVGGELVMWTCEQVY
jgi:alpha-galactosidase